MPSRRNTRERADRVDGPAPGCGVVHRLTTVTSAPLAMFPLAAVVFPTTELPLHVFERRYQCLTRDVLLGSQEFGICLISKSAA